MLGQGLDASIAEVCFSVSAHNRTFRSSRRNQQIPRCVDDVRRVNRIPVQPTPAPSAANHRRHHGTCRSRSNTVCTASRHAVCISRRVGEPARRRRREPAAQPVRDLRRVRRQVDVALQLARENRRTVALAKRRRAAQREGDDRGERKTVRRRVLLLAEQLLRCARTPAFPTRPATSSPVTFAMPKSASRHRR